MEDINAAYALLEALEKTLNKYTLMYEEAYKLKQHHSILYNLVKITERMHMIAYARCVAITPAAASGGGSS